MTDQRARSAEEVLAELECPECGGIGAVADADGYFHDGQPLVCGCKGHVMCDSENEPSILILEVPDHVG